ncbi:MAG: hypothetical protein WCB67_00200 [Solirubrobacteraceae bacterium]
MTVTAPPLDAGEDDDEADPEDEAEGLELELEPPQAAIPVANITALASVVQLLRFLTGLLC